MPALFSSVAAFTRTPLGTQLSPYWSQLEAGALDAMLMEASDEVETYCRRRLALPTPVTAPTGATGGSSSITLTPATNIAPGDAIALPSGQVVTVQGVSISDAQLAVGSATGVYAGTATLSGPLNADVATGATLTPVRQSHLVVRGRSSHPLFGGELIPQSAQLAMAHSPGHGLGLGGNAPRLTLGDMPLWRITAAYATYPFATGSETAADISGWQPQPAGWVQLPIGFFNPEGTIWRIQYLAGYADVPRDIRTATHLYLAAEIARAMNEIGAYSLRADGQGAQMAANRPDSHSFFVDEAERKLEAYRRRSGG